MKVAIIGAGTCGLYLAWKLAEKHQVTVFEKKENIGNEVCSGLFSERILNFFPESGKLIQNKINSVLVHFPKKTIKIEFSKKFLLISHYELDRLALSLAEKAGAKIVLNCNITKLSKGLALTPRPGRGSDGFDKIIGCDGANSFVRRHLKLPEPDFRLGIQGFIKEEDSRDFVEVWPVKTGFIWKIPRGREIEYGIMAHTGLALRLFKEFLEKRNLSFEEIKSKVIPQGFVMSNNPLIALCGDSAGLTKPWSGGGVIWGLKAADMLLKYFPDLIRYNKEAKRFFKPKISLSKKAVSLVYLLGFNAPWLLPKNNKIESDYLL